VPTNSPVAAATGKALPWTQEQADLQLNYLPAVALLDGGQVGHEQLETERVRRADVQEPASRVDVKQRLTDRGTQNAPRLGCLSFYAPADRVSEQSDFEGPPSRGRCRGQRVDEVRLARRNRVVDDALRSEMFPRRGSLDRILRSLNSPTCCRGEPDAEACS